MSYNPIILGKQHLPVSRQNLIFCVCPSCGRDINWRHEDPEVLYASCCVFAFAARPRNENYAVYIIEFDFISNMKNVIQFPKRKLHLVRPPPKDAA